MSENKSQNLSKVAENVDYLSTDRYIFRGNFIFEGIPLEGKRILDVGCGKGALALWAAINNADYVLGLEPEIEGSTSGTYATFQRLINELGFESFVEASHYTIEEISGMEPFDIIIANNVINHLDETAVQLLPYDHDSVLKYLYYINLFRTLVKEEGTLILADCARNNLWGNLGLKSPFAPTIEWNKHQNPEIWVDLFSKEGFVLKDLRWSPIYYMPRISRNHFINYMIHSHFVLRLSI